MANEVHHRGWGRFTIEDDRGDRRALRTGSGRKSLTAKQRRAERRAQWLSGGGYRPLDWFAFAVGLFVAMLGSDWAYTNWILPAWPAAPRFFANLALFPMFVVVMAAIQWRVNRAAAIRRPVVNRILTRAWMCPACHGSLGECVPGVDGLVVCPHCQAAWAASRFDGPGEPEHAPIDTMGRAESLLALMLERSAPIVAKDDAGSRAVLLSGSMSVPIVDSPSSERQKRLDLLETRQAFPRSVIYITAGLLAALGLIAMTGLGMVAAVGVAVLIVWIDLRQEPKRLRRAALRLWLCPSCAEDLEGVPPDADGFVRCPLCDAAWRATDVAEGTQPNTPILTAAP